MAEAADVGRREPQAPAASQRPTARAQDLRWLVDVLDHVIQRDDVVLRAMKRIDGPLRRRGTTGPSGSDSCSVRLDAFGHPSELSCT
jgi:hypothetical protein